MNTQLKTFSYLFLLSLSGSLSAEGVLLKSDPPNNAEISDFGGEIKLWFSGNVSKHSPSVVVVDSQGNRVDNQDTRLVLGERSRLTATTQALKPGAYTVRYRVVTEDGLIVSGIQHFTYKP